MNFDIFGLDVTSDYKKEPAEWSVEAMQEELQAIEETYDNMDEMERTETFYKACEAEMNIKSLAAMEAQDIADATEIFSKYGLTDSYALEAAKDVLAREMYRGVAKVKTLVAAIIKFIQELITFGGTTNKAYAKLKKLAKQIKEALKKKISSKKVQEDKFAKEIYSLSTEELNKICMNGFPKKMNKNGDPVGDLLKRISQGYLNGHNKLNRGGQDANSIYDLYEVSLNFVKSFGAGSNLPKVPYSLDTYPSDAISEVNENLKEFVNEFKDSISDAKEEYEKNELIVKAISNAEYVYTTSDAKSKNKDLKQLEKFKKTLSKLTSDKTIRDFMGKDSSGSTNLNNGLMTMSSVVNVTQFASSCIGLMITHYKKHNSMIIRLFDNMLTECKAVEAMAA